MTVKAHNLLVLATEAHLLHEGYDLDNTPIVDIYDAVYDFLLADHDERLTRLITAAYYDFGLYEDVAQFITETLA